MARVYLAESVGSGLLRKLVVLKVLNQELASDPEMRQAFVREAEISARLNHPNIVNVHEVFEQGNTAVMVMHYLEGMALSDILSRLQGAIPLKLHLNILCQVLDALHYFHELRDANGDPLECVHRDVSPHNVMVLHEGGIKVVDFGVAKVRAQSENHTRTGVIKGKVAYMPPEQLLACGSVDRRADLYSVGVMLWEAVAGRRMWRGMDASARMRAIIRGEIPDIRKAAPGVSDTLARIIERALDHAPDGRYATAEEMQIDLEQVALTEGGHSSPREIAEFMRANFGEERREKQRTIEKAVGDRDFTLADATWSVSDSPTAMTDKSFMHPALPAPSVAIVTSRPWRKTAIAAALVAGIGLTAGALTMWGPTQPQATAGQLANGATGPVTLRIESEPAGADVFLGGVHAGVTPLVQTRAASTDDLNVEVRASGRIAQSKVVRLQDDIALAFALQPEIQNAAPDSEATRSHEAANAEPAAIAPRTASPAEEQERRQALTRGRRPVARQAEPAAREKPTGDTQKAESPATPAASSAANSPDSCNPPYRLDPGGVKVFKPHCF
jgi:eukaryotic-like serine/threonine-protein kinase